ncbi:hypothetical protein ATANTOWER_022238 [Ataeniobius toweri]|uniref:Proteasome beta subunit C-terminal domain-containing protein n=1 Tax=Ataeniobius toweri TaxID=208326 RepID=A0ABU7AHU4_9TELE|nr:hypothetical protein [Ataeniobius toweri]
MAYGKIQTGLHVTFFQQWLSSCHTERTLAFAFINTSKHKTAILLLFLSAVKLEEAKQLVRDAIAAGIFCDLGSGSNVDVCVITEAGVQFLRGYDKPTAKGQREGQYRYKPGTTAVLTKTETLLSLDVVDESVHMMDTA